MSKCELPKTQVGGQAVIEGVMMRSPRSLCVAVRRPSGEIAVKEDTWRSIWEKHPLFKFLRKPFFRGSIILLEALINGLSALSFSASQAQDEEEEKLSNFAIGSTIALAMVLAIGLFVGLPHLLAWGFGALTGLDTEGKSLSFHAIDGVFKVGIFVLYIYLISFMKEIRRVFQYHGAEHKAIFAYENGQELTVENAQTYTTLHPRCGTAFLINVILLSIIMFSLIFPFMPTLVEIKFFNHLLYILIKIPMIFPLAGLAYEINRWASKHMDLGLVRALLWPGLMLQRITTKAPTDDQVEVALTALRKNLWRERVLDEMEEGHSKQATAPGDAAEATDEPASQDITEATETQRPEGAGDENPAAPDSGGIKDKIEVYKDFNEVLEKVC